jgi:excinuclease UvrABC helicase subunit UvrB
MELEMRDAAEKLNFELAIALRDQIALLQKEIVSKKELGAKKELK